jgi:UDP-N-acetylglucosamine 1-carboxyvinyltransferase
MKAETRRLVQAFLLLAIVAAGLRLVYRDHALREVHDLAGGTAYAQGDGSPWPGLAFHVLDNATWLFAGPELRRELFTPERSAWLEAGPLRWRHRAWGTLGPNRAQVDTLGGVINASAGRLVGTDIFLDLPSVGATVNSMLTAVSAEGLTQIHNAAREPHVVDLANFLSSMGASVKGAGTDVIRIRGGRHLHGANYAIIPDQIQTGTIMIAAAATGGDVTITGAIPTHMESLSAKLLEMGVSVYTEDDLIRVRGSGFYRSVNVKTLGYPGFPTDLQQPLSALLTIARGTSIVTETVFENRFRFLDELRRMGANVRVIETTAIITGVDQLVGARINATDLRAGAAMVVAGLTANGVTDIGGVDYIQRGYENMDQKLIALGARIEQIEA